MILNGIFVVDDVSPAPRAPASDSHPRRPAQRKPARDLRLDAFSHLAPAKPASPRRVNVDGLTAKLASISKSVRAATVKQPEQHAADVRPQPSLQPQLAEMNRRNRAFWQSKTR
jgi:hypothetical protein